MATPTTQVPVKGAQVPVKGARLALLIGGLIAIAFGVAVLVWPTKAAVALTGVIALYAVLSGIVYIAMGFTSKKLNVGGRLGHILLGVLFVIAGFYAFNSLQQSAAFLAVFITVMVGVMWVMEGFVSLFTLDATGSKGLTVAFAIISILAGFYLLSSIAWGVVFLWVYLGISMIVLGVLNVFRAIAGRRE